jgi:hypothetical protein
MSWYFIQFITLCPITIFDNNVEICGRPVAALIAPRPMLTGEIRSRIGAVWNAYWTGGISNRSRSSSRSLTCSYCAA